MKLKVVLDTNVFISGIFWKGNFCSQIIEKWKNEEIILISSLELIEEFVDTLKDFKIQMPLDMIENGRTLFCKILPLSSL